MRDSFKGIYSVCMGVVPSVDDDTRMSWVEFLTDFVTKLGSIWGFLTPGMPMSRPARKMKTHVGLRGLGFRGLGV